MHRHTFTLSVGLAVALSAGGCAGSSLVDSMQRADTLVANAEADAVSPWRAAVSSRQAPSVSGPRTLTPALRAELRRIAPDLSALSLHQMLSIATTFSRDYRFQVESLRLAASSLYGARAGFEPVVNAVLDGTLSGTHDPTLTHLKRSQVLSSGWALNVTQALPWGGSLSGSVNNTLRDEVSGNSADPHTVSVGASVTWTQPLLRGFGMEDGLESLTVAERRLADGVRNFQLFRQDFLILWTRTYYGLLARKVTVANAQKRLDQAAFEFRRMQALFAVGDVSEIQVLQAEQQRLLAEDSLIQSRDFLQDAFDAAAIDLGLPVHLDFDVVGTVPAARAPAVDVDRATRTALAYRLDLSIERDTLEDSRRSLRIAKRQLWPDLDLNATYSNGTRPIQSYGEQEIDRHQWSIGLGLTIPIYNARTGARESLFTAQISLDRAEREFQRVRDQLVIGVRETARRLVRSGARIAIQDRIRKSAEKNLRVAQLRLEQGEISSRDLGEARDTLFDAENTYIGNLVDLEIARLQMLRDTGVLLVEREGMSRR